MPSVLDYLSFVFSMISCVMYIFTISILINNRKSAPFNSDFFKLFVSLSVADLASGINSNLEITKQWGWLDWTPFYRHKEIGWLLSRIPISGYIWASIAQYIGVLTLAANRYYNVEFPLWTPTKQVAALTLQWLTPTLAIIPYVYQNFSISTHNDSGVVYLTAGPHYKTTVAYTFGMIAFQTTVILLVGTLYWRIFFKIRKIKNDFGLTDDNQSELRLALVGFVLFVLMLAQQLITGSLMMAALFGSPLFGPLKKLLYHMAGIFAFMNPWLLVACSKPTRDAMRGCFWVKKNRVEPAQQMFLKAQNALPAKDSQLVCEDF